MPEIMYIPVGDYFFPNIILREPPPGIEPPLDRYGRMRRAFLKEHRPILYSELLLSEKLYPHLREIDEAARNRLSLIPDHEAAHEIILTELIYD